jgi:tetrahydromethanopterin S-methyltransferase subunit F
MAGTSNDAVELRGTFTQSPSLRRHWASYEIAFGAWSQLTRIVSMIPLIHNGVAGNDDIRRCRLITRRDNAYRALIDNRACIDAGIFIGSCAAAVIVNVPLLLSVTVVTRYCCAYSSDDSTTQTHSASGVSL